MCSPVTCRICGKTTWTGCGLHIEEALAGVPEERRCPGHESPAPQAAAPWPPVTPRG